MNVEAEYYIPSTNSYLVTFPYFTLCRSLSFVMVTTGLAFIFFAFVYIIVDARRWWSGAPFLFAGNTLYIGKNQFGIVLSIL